MSAKLHELENVLNLELGIFKKILKLEEDKKNAILNRDPGSMENFCREQEKHLSGINPLENSRQKIILKFSEWYKSKNPSLKEIAETEGSGNTGIVRTGEELRRILGRIKALQDTNTMLIKDNLDLFSRIVSKLKGFSSEEEFGRKKSGQKQANPLLMDRKI